jgi:hypothetical protein
MDMNTHTHTHTCCALSLSWLFGQPFLFCSLEFYAIPCELTLSCLVMLIVLSPGCCAGLLFEIGSTGISSLQGHSEHRTQCVNHFVSVYGYMPLVASHVKVVDARNQWLW